MGVSGHASLHASFGQEPLEVGKHRVDAGKILPREHPTAVEKHPAPARLDDSAVASYLPESSEECDGYRFGHVAPG